ncbi:hypothetical protein ZPR_3285 [Zunongwangia profunda SM-A87]|uniref:Uncharacterized protein n=1 Tax=Zunongwangia profunda (strain DSM 18752 / CCTCC AB 206139 / SM-A87) TaxID=655815 RepID=D5BIW8_ZUNPS|nr:hypothetical protein ZPR_3285 [Zunongwangia profunda SM-A87]
MKMNLQKVFQTKVVGDFWVDFKVCKVVQARLYF